MLFHFFARMHASKSMGGKCLKCHAAEGTTIDWGFRRSFVEYFGLSAIVVFGSISAPFICLSDFLHATTNKQTYLSGYVPPQSYFYLIFLYIGVRKEQLAFRPKKL